MKKKFNFPIRFKIIFLLLLMITVVVGIITFAMAKMFHADKTAYIHDLTSTIALHKSEEVSSLLAGYSERIRVIAKLMYEKELYQEQKSKLLVQLFHDFQEFISITLYEEGTEPVTVYDTESLKEAGLSNADFFKYREDRPLPMDQIRQGEVFVENSTLTDKLPALTMAIGYQPPDAEKATVITAIIRLDSLLRVAGGTKVFEAFIVDSRGNLLVHSDPKKVFPIKKVNWVHDIADVGQNLSHGITREYVRNGIQMVGGFARTDVSGLLAGVQIQKSAAYLTARELLNNLIVASLVILVLAAILALFWSRRLTRPIEWLSKATRVVGKGKFDIRVERSSRDEIGELADSFNTMASELDTRERALNDAQSALVHSEKMAAFGQLGAGIAHEVKNPLAGILGFAQLSLRKVDEESPLHKNLTSIEKETKRCKNIIENLLKFARQEKVSYQLSDINRIIEDTITLMDHQLGIHRITVEKDLASELPHIMGNTNQIQQVLMNLMLNAQQAMNGNPGVITFMTRLLNEEQIEVHIGDNGPGIPEDIQEKIFDPFFTTKPSGQGTGLGLSVSYGIIKDHRGDIRIESKEGKGTTFIITFPVSDREEIPGRSAESISDSGEKSEKDTEPRV